MKIFNKNHLRFPMIKIIMQSIKKALKIFVMKSIMKKLITVNKKIIFLNK